MFGTAARIDHIDGIEALREAILCDCTSLTPEFDMNWNCLEPAPGRLQYARADALCRFARDSGLKMRGHSLLWDQGTPQWAKDHMSESHDWSIVERFFASVIPRYSGDVGEWDVVNEAIDIDGTPDGLRHNAFLRAFGPDYIRRAFETARRHAPNAQLVINEYSLEYDNETEGLRRRAFLGLLERLKTSGVPVDRVGIQAHLHLSKGMLKPKIIAPFLQSIADMGFQVAITELDVKEEDLAAPLDVRDRRVSDEVHRYLDIALAQPAVRSVTAWGLSDRYSWLQDKGQKALARANPAVLNRGLPYDANLQPKLMHSTIAMAFAGATV